ncbi:MAG: ion channel, partial [Longimicrobiales bacterium]
VTMSTVGFGDIAPSTPLGQVLAAMLMIIGYSVIAVPTGIVTAEIASLPGGGGYHAIPCPSCENIEVDPDAKYCRFCGVSLRHHS